MIISSRTPEGFPARCSLCGAATNLEFSSPADDAPCPNCGVLVWKADEMLLEVRNRLKSSLHISPLSVTPDATFDELGVDSLDQVELVLELESEFGFSSSLAPRQPFRSIGDLIRYFDQRGRS